MATISLPMSVTSSAGGPNGASPANQPWGAAAIDAASHGAIAFCQIYYECYDEPARRASEIPLLYLPSSKIIWNGNPVLSEPSALSEFLASMPLSRHDLQTLDCHPLSAEPNSPPSLIIDVTGSVLHGPTVLAPPTSASNDKSASSKGEAPRDTPRKFHEMFMLRAIEQGEGMQPKYAIHSSNFRFIG
ncbi:hypothetical protein CI109_102651 [Kwoniella shandongensis]|uniref:Uncharacterized protein n=1 Tax=Kwoniella shandongensis TaxID=1734106 RepID=A0A5M6BW08_9TREE|nr:uncharacterized protein CI109_005231 [Kwoniella shandongensis]KAA5526461.1 hypothetical protein CI109_005231 [Kwoniella shandongensis]